MATALSVTLLGAQPQTGSIEVGTSVAAQQVRSYRVTFDAATATAYEAWNADAGVDGRVPALGSALNGYLLSRKVPRQLDANPCEWDVECTFTLPVPGQESKPDDEEVERWSQEITMNGVPIEFEVDRDANNSPIVNTACDPISNIKGTRHDVEIAFAFTALTIDWPGLDDFFPDDTVNGVESVTNFEDVVLTINGQERTFAPDTLRTSRYSLLYVLDANGQTYPRMTYYLVHRRSGWTRNIANQGFNGLDAIGKYPFLTFYDPSDKRLQASNGAGGVVLGSPQYLRTIYDGDVPALVDELPAGNEVEVVEVNIYSQVVNMQGRLLWGIAT